MARNRRKRIFSFYLRRHLANGFFFAYICIKRKEERIAPEGAMFALFPSLPGLPPRATNVALLTELKGAHGMCPYDPTIQP